MLRVAMWTAFLLATSPAWGQTHVFLSPPDPAQATQVPDLPFVVAQYPVTVDICGIGKSLYPSPHGSLIVDLPTGAVKAIQVKSMSLVAGFDGGADQICADPQALRYSLYGVAYGFEMTLYVNQGRVS